MVLSTNTAPKVRFCYRKIAQLNTKKTFRPNNLIIKLNVKENFHWSKEDCSRKTSKKGKMEKRISN